MSNISVLAALLYSEACFAQSPGEDVDVQGGENSTYDPNGYSETFGISRSARTNIEKIPALPKTRQDWLTIAQRIRSEDIDYEIYYAVLRGDMPKDIFTPELMAIYQPKYEVWLLKRWDDSILEGPESVKKGPFAVYTMDGDMIYGSMPRGQSIKCDPSGEKSGQKLNAIVESDVPPSIDQINTMYQTMFNEIACLREGSVSE